MSMKNRRGAAITVIAGLALVAGGVAIGEHRSSHRTIRAGEALQTTIKTDSDPSSTNSTEFVVFPGAELPDFEIANAETRVVVARLTGESNCTGGPAGTPCFVRIVARSEAGQFRQLYPASNNQVLDRSGPGGSEMRSVERARELGEGTWTISVEWRTGNSDTTFTIDDWAVIIGGHAPIPFG